MTDRFAHQLRLDQIREGERLELVADEAERSAIAQRLALPGIERLDAVYPALAVSLAALVGVSLATPPPRKEQVEPFL